MLIYKIELFDGRMYIGQTTTSLEKRIQAYKRDVSTYLNGKYRSRSKIIRALAKYGFDNFRIFKIDTSSSQEELDRKEQFWISVYNSSVQGIGFNIQLGGFGIGKHSDETKKIMSEKKKGKPPPNKGKSAYYAGEKAPNALFTQIEADLIREQYKNGKSSIKLSREFGVSKQVVLKILNNETYKTSAGKVMPPIQKWYVYLIQSSKDNTIYTGITLDVEARLKTHNDGRGARYTKGRGPFIVLKSFERPTKSEALKLEYQIKQLSKEEKLNYTDV